MPWAYLFETKGIQRYILDTGRRRDLVGASDLVARLARSDRKDRLAEAIAAANFKTPPREARRASGAFALVSDDKEELTRLRALWRLIVQVEAPGLEFVDALASGESDLDDDDLRALRAARAALPGVRDNGVADLSPLGSPATALAARTGRPRIVPRGDDAQLVGSDDLDLAALPQRRRSRDIATRHDAVAERFISPDRRAEDYVFPRNFDDEGGKNPETGRNPLFPFNPDKPWIGVVHADLSGMGQFFTRISQAIAERGPANAAEELFRISKRVEDGVERAAQRAALPLLDQAREFRLDETKRLVPARPIVQGGDDTTIIVRADLAFAFAVDFLEAVEEKTRTALDSLRTLYGDALPDCFTACAGVAFSTGSYPFDAGNALAEDLCAKAKESARTHSTGTEAHKANPSCLAFHAITSTERESYEAIGAKEAGAGADLLTMQPWFAGGLARSAGLRPHADALMKLVNALKEQAAGLSSLRALRSEWLRDREGAKRVWARWREISREDDENALETLDSALDALGCAASDRELPCDKEGRTPLFDALMLSGWEAPE